MWQQNQNKDIIGKASCWGESRSNIWYWMGIEWNLKAYAGLELPYKYDDGAMDVIEVEIEILGSHSAGSTFICLLWG